MKSNNLNTILRLVMSIAVLALAISPLSAQMMAKNADGTGSADKTAGSPDVAKARVVVNDGGTGDTGGKTKDVPSSALPRVIKFSGALPVSGDAVDGASAQITFSL